MSNSKINNKKVKKEIYISTDEKKRNQAIIDSIKTKFEAKTLKIGFTFKKEGSTQEHYEVARFTTKEDIKKYANEMLGLLNKKKKAWKLVKIDDLHKDDEQNTDKVEDKED